MLLHPVHESDPERLGLALYPETFGVQSRFFLDDMKPEMQDKKDEQDYQNEQP